MENFMTGALVASSQPVFLAQLQEALAGSGLRLLDPCEGFGLFPMLLHQ